MALIHRWTAMNSYRMSSRRIWAVPWTEHCWHVCAVSLSLDETETNGQQCAYTPSDCATKHREKNWDDRHICLWTNENTAVLTAWFSIGRPRLIRRSCTMRIGWERPLFPFSSSDPWMISSLRSANWSRPRVTGQRLYYTNRIQESFRKDVAYENLQSASLNERMSQEVTCITALSGRYRRSVLTKDGPPHSDRSLSVARCALCKSGADVIFR
jgi:hypothetical protein